MDYQTALLYSKRDLESYPLEKLIIAAKYYGIPSKDPEIISTLLARKFLQKSYMPQGCHNEEDPFTFDDEIPEKRLVRSTQSMCWDAVSLANFIISKKGINKYSQEEMAEHNLHEEQIYTDFIIDELYFRLETLGEEALKKKLEETLRPNVDLITKEFMKELLNTGMILHGIGSISEEIKEKWPEELQKEWATVTKNIWEPPENMSAKLSGALLDLKSDVYSDFYINVYSKQPDDVKNTLTRLHETLNEDNFTSCKMGQYCMKMFGVAMLNAYNKWAKLTGEPEYENQLQLGIDDQLEIVRYDPEVLRTITSEDLHLAAIEENPDVFMYIDNPTERVYSLVLEKYGLTRNPSEKEKLEAVKKNGMAIQVIKDPSSAVQLEAVKNNSEAIRAIKNPTSEAQMEAVSNDPSVIYALHNPSEELQIVAVSAEPGILVGLTNIPSEAVKLAAVRADPEMIEYIANPSETMQLIAVKANPELIEFIPDPSETVQLIAVKANPELINYISNPTPAVLRAANQ